MLLYTFLFQRLHKFHLPPRSSIHIIICHQILMAQKAWSKSGLCNASVWIITSQMTVTAVGTKPAQLARRASGASITSYYMEFSQIVRNKKKKQPSTVKLACITHCLPELVLISWNVVFLNDYFHRKCPKSFNIPCSSNVNCIKNLLINASDITRGKKKELITTEKKIKPTQPTIQISLFYYFANIFSSTSINICQRQIEGKNFPTSPIVPRGLALPGLSLWAAGVDTTSHLLPCLGSGILIALKNK